MCLFNLSSIGSCLHVISVVIFGGCGSCVFFVIMEHYKAFTPYFSNPFGELSGDGTSITRNMCNVRLRC